MRFYRPHSFFALLLTGFVFVSLPLLTALYSSVQVMEDLVQQSAFAVYRSVDRVSNSRHLVELLLDQERKARLYNVLGEPSQLDAVNQIHEQVADILEHFSMGSEDADLLEQLEQLRAMEQYQVAVLNRMTSGPELRKKELEQVLARYRDLNALALNVAQASNQLMISEVEALKEKVRENKQMLAWQTSGLIGFSLLLIALFVVLISKPVAQIDRGIEQLGDGDFQTPIHVSGPKDLEVLGQKLDWLRKRLAQLDREKVKLVAHISHELKTPLSSIKEGAGLLKEEVVGAMNSRQQDVVRILDKNCTKLQKLIENILDFNMAQARKIPLEKKPVRLDAVIDEVVADQRNSIIARRIKLDVQVSKAVVSGDRTQLKTIFDNLLSNAIKFVADEGEISIRMHQEDRKVTVMVEDNGPGIRDQERSRIFSPFYQGKSAKSTVVKGSGLGLAIAKEYVQNHGGSIRLLSSRQGARFAVILPLTS
ncbi:two-component sensor histidine kinase [Desulfolithobacter dissulfuricans]|uniref:histidine kinase n=1 Tax=Desulfolithobacter dissulfuricans TaxID=2795293 RepID=A0A915XIL0_9BACT|nr:ATP-binding protein [Desulfolithobacter dissulfuricans]BCO07707.1 two-component sensor histidine kinase [Desulfolithobacter dissulfuricans]